MSGGRIARLSVLSFAIILLIGLLEVSTAANTVPSSRAGLATVPIDADALKPSACASMHLTTLVTGAGKFTGTNGNDLILGSSGNDTIDGGLGDDCIVGGGGNDKITGGGGSDVCIGGSGNDNFHGCEIETQ